MTSNFEAFGIERVTPSAMKVWAFEDRGVWLAKYIFKVFEDAGPAAWRGDAIEAGFQFSLEGRKGDPLDRAREVYESRSREYSEKHDGEIHPDFDKHWREVELGLPRAIKAWETERLPKPISYQQGVSCYLSGAPSVQVYGKYDFAWGIKGKGGSRDLKTTSRLPSTPKDGGAPQPHVDHGIQASIYADARKEEDTGLLYVSVADKPQKPHLHIPLGREEIDFYIRAAVAILWQMDATLEAAIALSQFKAVTKEDALAELCRPNFLAQGGGTYPIWKPEFSRAARAKVLAWDFEEDGI